MDNTLIIWICGIAIGVILHTLRPAKNRINTLGLYMQIENMRKKHGIKILNEQGVEIKSQELKTIISKREIIE